MQDWEFFIKNFDDISKKPIADKNLLRLDILILMPSYLKEEKSYFIEITEDDNENLDKDAKKKLMIFNLKKKVIKKRVMYRLYHLQCLICPIICLYISCYFCLYLFCLGFPLCLHLLCLYL